MPTPTADSALPWVDRIAPAWFRPYSRLARFDRPIGTWLLLLPCWWGAALAASSAASAPNPVHLVLFAIGALVMRGAGCTLNDIVDRNLDGKVDRTRNRPLPAGQVTVRQAVMFMGILAFIGLLVLVQFNTFTIVLGFASLAPVAIYPFMKRFTDWPQLFLGVAFNWGALVGWSAAMGGLSAPALVLYVGGIAWTLGYDTIYAHQDKEDDALIGIRSTARRFGDNTKPWLWFFYGLALVLIAAAAWSAGLGWAAYPLLLLAGAHFVWQIRTLDIDDAEQCLNIFRSNRDTGLLVLAALLAGAF